MHSVEYRAVESMSAYIYGKQHHKHMGLLASRLASLLRQEEIYIESAGPRGKSHLLKLSSL